MKRTLCTTLFLAVALSACDNKSDDGKAQAENAAASSVASSQESTPAASSQKAVDVYQLDIAGVRLGMSWDEATAAVKEKLQLSDGDINAFSLPGDELPRSFKIRHGDAPLDEMEVNFLPDYLHGQPENRVVSKVAFSKQKGSGGDDLAEMFKASEAKYGPPTVNKIPTAKRAEEKWAAWCSPCEPGEPSLALVSSHPFVVYLTLDDPRYQQAVRDQKKKDNPPKFWGLAGKRGAAASRFFVREGKVWRSSRIKPGLAAICAGARSGWRQGRSAATAAAEVF